MPEDITKDTVKKDLALGDLNPKMFRQFFADMQIKSYQYDYQIQRDLVAYHEERFTTAQLKTEVGIKMFDDVNSERVLVFPMKHQFIATGRRKAWRDSAIYNKVLTFDDINRNRKLFKYNVLVFVDNKLITNIRIKPNEEFTYIYFRRKDLAKYLIDTPKVINVLFIPNAIVSVAETINATNTAGSKLLLNAFYSTKREFNVTDNYFAIFQNKQTLETEFTGGVHYNPDYTNFTFDGINIADYADTHRVILVGTELLFKIKAVSATQRFVDFELQKMPLPKDDIIVLYKHPNRRDYVPNDGTVVLTEHYPNIIEISNPQKYQLLLIALYDEATQNRHIKFDTEMDFYLETERLLDRYQQGSVPELLQNYKPADWDYRLKDYFEKNDGIQAVDMSDRWNPFHYKMNTISGLIKLWAEFYLEYERRTYGFLTGWYHDISKWSAEHLASKERNSTEQDVPVDPTGHIQVDRKTFAETQYVFTYKNDMKFDDANSYLFYIDGKMVIPSAIIVHRGFQYVYLPKRLIKPDSMIEVERFDGINFGYWIPSIPQEGLEVPLKNILKTSTVANSFFLTNKENEFVNDRYDVFVIDTEMDNVESKLDLTNSVYYISPKMKLRIVPKDPVNANKGVFLRANNQLVTYTRKNSGDDYLRDIGVNFNLQNNITNVKQDVKPRLRIYTEDGRLFSKNSYVIYKHENFKQRPKFNLPIKAGETAFHRIAYVGYDERLIYHRRHVRNDGFVDLEGKTSRPICLAYHDIYLNGVRLHKKDIKIIAPFKFIITTLKKHNTLDNLEIYEKVHASDAMFKFDIDEDSAYLADRLFNKDKEYQKHVLDSLEKVNPDGKIKDLNEIRNWYKDLLDDWFFNRFVNADRRYDLELYEPLFDENYGYRVLLNGDDRVRWQVAQENRFYMWHDKTLEETGGVNPPPRNVYDGLANDNIPDDSVTITEREYIENGISFGNVKTIYDYDTEILHEKEEETPEPTELDGVDLHDLNPANYKMIHDRDSDEDGNGYKRTHISTYTKPKRSVNPHSLPQEPPADVTIVPFVDPNPRMPEHIATPEPTLPEPGEYEAVTEPTDSVIKFLGTNPFADETKAKLSVIVENEFDHTIKEVAHGTTLPAKKLNIVRIKFRATEELSRKYYVKVVDADNHLVYTHLLSHKAEDQINQVLNIIPGSMTVTIEKHDPSRGEVKFPLYMEFNSGFPDDGVLSNGKWEDDENIDSPKIFTEDTYSLYDEFTSTATFTITKPGLVGPENKLLVIRDLDSGKIISRQFCKPNTGSLTITLHKPITRISLAYEPIPSTAKMIHIDTTSPLFVDHIKSIYTVSNHVDGIYVDGVGDIVMDTLHNGLLRVDCGSSTIRVLLNTAVTAKSAFFDNANNDPNDPEVNPFIHESTFGGNGFAIDIPVPADTEFKPGDAYLTLFNAKNVLKLHGVSANKEEIGTIVVPKSSNLTGERINDIGRYKENFYPLFANGRNYMDVTYKSPVVLNRTPNTMTTVRVGTAEGTVSAVALYDPNKQVRDLTFTCQSPFNEYFIANEAVDHIYKIEIGESDVDFKDIYTYSVDVGNATPAQYLDRVTPDTSTDKRYVNFIDNSIFMFNLVKENKGAKVNLGYFDLIFTNKETGVVVDKYRYDNRANATRALGDNALRLDERYNNCVLTIKRYIPPRCLELTYGAGVPSDGILSSNGWRSGRFAPDTFPMYGEGETGLTRTITIEHEQLLNVTNTGNETKVLTVTDNRTRNVIAMFATDTVDMDDSITFTAENPSYGFTLQYVTLPMMKVHVGNVMTMCNSITSTIDGITVSKVVDTGSQWLYVPTQNDKFNVIFKFKDRAVASYHLETATIPIPIDVSALAANEANLTSEIHQHAVAGYHTPMKAVVNNAGSSFTMNATSVPTLTGFCNNIASARNKIDKIAILCLSKASTHTYLDLTVGNSISNDVLNRNAIRLRTMAPVTPEDTVYRPNTIEMYPDYRLYYMNSLTKLSRLYSPNIIIYLDEVFKLATNANDKKYIYLKDSDNKIIDYSILLATNASKSLTLFPSYNKNRYSIDLSGSSDKKIYSIGMPDIDDAITKYGIDTISVVKAATVKRLNQKDGNTSLPVHIAISFGRKVDTNLYFTEFENEYVRIETVPSNTTKGYVLLDTANGYISATKLGYRTDHVTELPIPNNLKSNTATLKFIPMTESKTISVEGFSVENNYCDILHSNATLSIGAKSLGKATWDLTHIPYQAGDILAVRLHATIPNDENRAIITVVERKNGIEKVAGLRILDKAYATSEILDIPFIAQYASGVEYIVRLITTKDLGLGNLVSVTIDGQSGQAINTLHNNYIGGALNRLKFVEMVKSQHRNKFSGDKYNNDGNIPVIFNSIGYNTKPNEDTTQCTITSPRRIKWLPGMDLKLFSQIPNNDKYEYRFTAIGTQTKQLTDPLSSGWKTVTVTNMQELDTYTIKVSSKRKILQESKLLTSGVLGYEYMNSADKLTRVNLNYNNGGDSIRTPSRDADPKEVGITDFPYGGSLTVYFAFDASTFDTITARGHYVDQDRIHHQNVSLKVGIQCVDAATGAVIATKQKHEWEIIAKKVPEGGDVPVITLLIAKVSIQPINKAFKIKLIKP